MNTFIIGVTIGVIFYSIESYFLDKLFLNKKEVLIMNKETILG